jgi:Zn-dependent M28 family amino/carboxypeptidase
MKFKQRRIALTTFILLVLIVLKLNGEERSIPNEMKAESKHLEHWVQKLCTISPSREVNHPSSLRQSIDIIQKGFEKHGLKTRLQAVPFRNKIFHNVVVTINAESKKDLVIVGAHYDVCGNTPGADDNASGVSGLLELSRLITQHYPKERPPLELVAYTLEEPPAFGSSFMGSAVHARSLKERVRNVDHMVCLESIGYYTEKEQSQRYPLKAMSLLYPNRGNFIAVVGNFSSKAITNQLTSALKRTGLATEALNAPGYVTGVDFSDHRNYWKHQYKAVMITDTALYRNPHYHQESDLPNTLNYKRMAQVVDGVFAHLMALGLK